LLGIKLSEPVKMIFINFDFYQFLKGHIGAINTWRGHKKAEDVYAKALTGSSSAPVTVAPVAAAPVEAPVAAAPVEAPKPAPVVKKAAPAKK